jgi:hypothetical protein
LSAEEYLELTDFLASKTISFSNCLAKYSGILPRGDMTHFQRQDKPIDFTQLLLMRKYSRVTLPSSRYAGIQYTARIFFKLRLL